MLKNYIKTAWRNVIRNKSYTAINIAGLAVGIAACLMIFMMVRFETSFDNFHTNKGHIYRVLSVFNDPSGQSFDSGTPLPISEGLRMDYPYLKHVAAILRDRGSLYTIENGKLPAKKFREDDAYYVGPSFFQIFNFSWLAGNKKTALSGPNTAVLTQDEADKFFGDWHHAMGKIIRYEGKTNLKVSGVLKNFPANTDFPLKLAISYANTREQDNRFYGNVGDWVSTLGDQECFVVLPDNVTAGQFDKSLKAFAIKHKPAEYAKDNFRLQPLKEMHYTTGIDTFGGHTFSKQLIGVISLIGLFLLLIACVNFINLATAQAVNRSKEVAVRKVLGGSRRSLFFQFISETFIITMAAVLLALVLTKIAMPYFSSLLAIKFDNNFITDPLLAVFLCGLIITMTLLSGFYPAMVISGFKPVTALKNKITAGKASGISLRRGLVIFQFVVAQTLVICMLVLIKQMNFLQSKPLGFAKNAVINVPFPRDSVSMTKLSALRNQLLGQPGVEAVSYSYGSPSDNNGWSSGFRYDNSPNETDFTAELKWADAAYFNLYRLKFIAGGPYRQSDGITGYVVNQTLLNKLGIRDPNTAIGKYISLWNNKSTYAPIVGVVKDFNISSLQNEIPPVLMGSLKADYKKLNIKIQPVHISRTLASVKKIWNGTFPDGLYEYQFLDKKIAAFYQSDVQLSVLYNIFAAIAIFVSCLGLYGLISFMTVQRTKEVGIRKTLGASVSNIVYLFSKEFGLLVIVAFLISAPVGWYFMSKWLQSFAYKIAIGPWIFVLAAILSIVIAWLTVGFKAIKAAMANPVNSLRSE